MSNDLISRKSVIDILESIMLNDSNLSKRYMAAEIRDKVNKIQTDNDGWIPVEERLPEEPGRYNVTFRSDGSVHEIGYGWYDLYSATYFSDDAILAWRPLPESYKPESMDFTRRK